MSKEHLDEKYMGEVYCKKCRKEGALVAELKAAGNNLHVDFYVQHPDERVTRQKNIQIVKRNERRIKS